MLREAALQAYFDRERLNAENTALCKAQSSRNACEMVESELGFKADPNLENGTAVVDGIEFCVSGHGNLRARISGSHNEYQYAGELVALGTMIQQQEEQRVREAEKAMKALQAPPKSNLLETAENCIAREEFEAASACALLSIARSLASLEANGITTTPITELI